jgi:hypothetical protein
MSNNYVDIRVNFSNQDELDLAIEKIRKEFSLVRSVEAIIYLEKY